MVKSIEERREKGELIETLPKISIVARGAKSSPMISSVLQSLHKLRVPNSQLLLKKHENLFPFDNAEDVSKFFDSKDGSLIVIGSNSKKRPNNLIFGRLFDSHFLDLVEFKLNSFEETASTRPIYPGLHPLMLFQGESFETDPVLTRVKNLFIDYFGGRPLDKVDSRGLSTLLCFTVTQDNLIHFHCYHLPDMVKFGPSFVLEVRRSQIADEKTFKKACKDPKLRKKVKNIKTNAMKETRGQVHLQQQDIKTIALKKRKDKKRKEDESKQE
jgi:ribosome production factor 2